ncbi:MAG: helix-turn-helix domain-containing protein [Cytophagaceae bacterium]
MANRKSTITISKTELDKIINTRVEEAIQKKIANPPSDELLSIHQICHFLNISKSTLYNHLARGLPSTSLNKKRYFNKSEVLQYLKSQK